MPSTESHLLCEQKRKIGFNIQLLLGFLSGKHVSQIGYASVVELSISHHYINASCS